MCHFVVKILPALPVSYITLRVHRINGQSTVPPLCSSLDLVMMNVEYPNDPAVNSYNPQNDASSISFLFFPGAVFASSHANLHLY